MSDSASLPKIEKSDHLDQTASDQPSSISAFISGAIDGAYRTPAKAIKQLMGSQDPAAISSEPTDSSNPANLPAESSAHRVGEIVGSFVPFVALAAITRGASVKLFGAEAAPSLVRTVGEQSVTGFAMGSLLSSSDLTPGENLLEARLKQGFGSALTFGTMAGTGGLLEKTLPEIGAGLLATSTRRFGIAALSGASGGIIDAETKTGFNATSEELVSSALGYAAFGTLMEGGGMALRSLRRNATSTFAEVPLPAAVKPGIEPLATEPLAAESLSSKIHFPDFSHRSDSSLHLEESPAMAVAAMAPDAVAPNAVAARTDLIHAEPDRPSARLANSPSDAGRIAQSASASEITKTSDIFPAGAHPDSAESSEAGVESTKRIESIAPKTDRVNDVNLLLKNELPVAREQMLDELKSVDGVKEGSPHEFKLYKTLMQTRWLTDAQKVRLTDVLCQVRDYYAQLNNPESGVAEKAQRSWQLTEASVAEAIHDTIEHAKMGKQPGQDELEDKILISVLSQFRIHRDEPYTNINRTTMRTDRLAGAQKILESIGYPQARINDVVQNIDSTRLFAQPVDQVRIDEDSLKPFTPVQAELPKVSIDPALQSEEAHQENWKYPSGTVKESSTGILTSNWKTDSAKGWLKRDPAGTSTVFDKVNDRKLFYDASGRIEQAKSAADSRSFFYDDVSGNLIRIQSDALGNLRNVDNAWYLEADNRHIGDGPMVADDNGDVRFILSDGVREYNMDGSVDWHPLEGRPLTYFANHSVELNSLQEKMANVFSRERLPRMEGLLNAFENEAAARGLEPNEKALLYRQLNRLLTDRPGSELAFEQRRDLAEQALSHAAFPTTVDQGYNNTCNVTTVEHRVYARTPHHIARLLGDIAADGTFTTHSGNIIDLKNSLTGIRPDYEARGSLELQQNPHSDDVKHDGDRDWASQLAQMVMIKLNHLNTTEMISKDVVFDRQSLVWDKDSKLIGGVDGHTIRPAVDSTGRPIDKVPVDGAVFRRGRGGYGEDLASGDLLVYDAHGKLLGSVEEPHVRRLYDYFGNRYDKLEPGSNYFDKDGSLVFYQTVPGDITYNKIQQKPDLPYVPTSRVADRPPELERLNARHLGKTISIKTLKNGAAEVISGPQIYTYRLHNINYEITGEHSKPFAITGDNYYRRYSDSIRISSVNDLGNTLLELKQSGNIPSVLMVHTGNPPFGNGGGGWHVVNFHDYDPSTGLVKITNQWGSRYDLMDPGVPISQIWHSMYEPPSPVNEPW